MRFMQNIELWGHRLLPELCDEIGSQQVPRVELAGSWGSERRGTRRAGRTAWGRQEVTATG